MRTKKSISPWSLLTWRARPSEWSTIQSAVSGSLSSRAKICFSPELLTSDDRRGGIMRAIDSPLGASSVHFLLGNKHRIALYELDLHDGELSDPFDLNGLCLASASREKPWKGRRQLVMQVAGRRDMGAANGVNGLPDLCETVPQLNVPRSSHDRVKV